MATAKKTTKTAKRTTKKGNSMNIIAGLDIGNGYVKGKVAVNGGAPERVDLPSCVAYTGHAAWLPAEADDAYMADFVNAMDCDIKSPAIKPVDEGRIFVGERAVTSGRSPVVFNIDERKPKCDDSLSFQLILATLAGVAVENAWKNDGKLPEESMQVEASLGVALPFSDYLQYRDRYRDELEGARHTVHIHNFENDITVNIDFTHVVVLAEGQAAQYAIAELGEKFLDAALAQCKKEGAVFDKSITGKELASYENTIGIDVGEGTTNYPTFRNGRIAVELSSSINKGYGTALENVIDIVRNEPFAPQTRKELERQLRDENPKPHMRKVQERLADFEADESRLLARDIVDEYKSVLSRIKLDTDVVYVFGGGATRLRDVLYPQLIEASKLADGAYVPIIYMDSAYSRELNRNGLFQVAQIAAEE